MESALAETPRKTRTYAQPQFLHTWTLHKYLIVELLPPLSMGLFLATGTLLLISVVDVLDMFVLSGIPFGPVVKILVSLFPLLFERALPIGCLLGAMLVYGRLAEDREIVAMRAAGVAGFTTLAPAYFLGVVLMLVNFYWTTSVTPKSVRMIRTSAQEMVEQMTSLSLFRPGQINTTPQEDLALYFSNVVPETNKIENLTIFVSEKGEGFNLFGDDLESSEASSWTGSAPTAQLKPIPSEKLFQIILENCVAESLQPEKVSRAQIDRATLSIDIGRRLAKMTDSGLTKENKTFGEFMDIADYHKNRFYQTIADLEISSQLPHAEIRQKVSEWRRISRENPTKAPIPPVLMEEVDHRIGDVQRSINRAMLRIAYPVGTFFFMAIGCALGVLAGRGKKTVSLLITVAVLLLYYSLEKGAESVAETYAFTVGFDPGFIIWTPTLLLMVLTLILGALAVRR